MPERRNTGKARLYADMQRLLATLMQRDIADPRLSGLSITRLEVVHGGQQVRVLVHKPGETEQTACVAQLNRLAVHFSHQLRHAMPRRRLPGLKFFWDESIDGAAGVTSLLASLEQKP
ncbi:MAG: 30S ribosome-binding factor RbfA [Mariprofundaceae bacterium]|nr:30S ribosome-binding factor RbfA [Mariprofundaceae bacterium]